MKKIAFIALTALFLGTSLTSCREQKSEKETLIEEMKADGADIKIKDGGDKIKMETDDKEVKIKTDDDGNVKIKVDDND
ncbi:hypothetical protein [Ulvibacter antarcticus]|uniref:Membrane or secreted protein n=1 Tax=Ulvibacter antarcticus TaxID=442714 RepID=A0A3L9YA90_9FLAO|nr:hypothetical protein [Ulvibacter antarcticus]RMA57601.1 hypothetical protein BXY75_2404 [Ulvibacter antarcticus]